MVSSSKFVYFIQFHSLSSWINPSVTLHQFHLAYPNIQIRCSTQYNKTYVTKMQYYEYSLADLLFVCLMRLLILNSKNYSVLCKQCQTIKAKRWSVDFMIGGQVCLELECCQILFELSGKVGWMVDGWYVGGYHFCLSILSA